MSKATMNNKGNCSCGGEGLSVEYCFPALPAQNALKSKARRPTATGSEVIRSGLCHAVIKIVLFYSNDRLYQRG